MDFIKVSKVENVELQKGKLYANGTLHLTAHHIIFNNDGKELWLGYSLIHTVERRSTPTPIGLYSIHIRCRDFQFITLSLSRESDQVDVFDVIQKLTCVASIDQLYAFFYRPAPPLSYSNGWLIFDPMKEFRRMGVETRTDLWRFSHINKEYKLCRTYPSIIVVPSKISDNVLNYAGKYRSKNRIPALTYLHWINNASITRSSQPMVGLKQNRSIQDEKLVECVFTSNLPNSLPSGAPIYGATQTNLIVDARGSAGAVANVARGAGTENMEHYKTGKKAYMGIDNIHVMRDSLTRMIDAIYESNITGQMNRTALAKCGWLKHIASLLEGTLLIVRNIHVNHSHVLVHCSDGWDRTSQLVSLAEICLDPYYRTLEGLQVLIEKDWVSFGHKFAERSGHLSSEKFFITTTSSTDSVFVNQSSQVNVSRDLQNAAQASAAFFQSVQNKIYTQSHIKETSPVFHQFLDCVHQLLVQNPKRFEYNDHLLRTLHLHLYSCQYGTFLFNNERERKEAKADSRTISIWNYINSNRDEFLDREYDPSQDDRMSGDMGILFPDKTKVKYWAELFDKQDDEMNPKNISPEATIPTPTSVVAVEEDHPAIENVDKSESEVEQIEDSIEELDLDSEKINKSVGAIQNISGWSNLESSSRSISGLNSTANGTKTPPSGSNTFNSNITTNRITDLGVNLTSAAGMAAAVTKSWFENVTTNLPVNLQGRTSSPSKGSSNSLGDREMSHRSNLNSKNQKDSEEQVSEKMNGDIEENDENIIQESQKDQELQNDEFEKFSPTNTIPVTNIESKLDPISPDLIKEEELREKNLDQRVCEPEQLFDPLGALAAPASFRELTIKGGGNSSE